MPKKERFTQDDAAKVPLPAALPILPPGTEDHTDYGYILDWMRRDMPDDEILYSPEAPPTVEKQWAAGVKAQFKFGKAPK